MNKWVIVVIIFTFSVVLRLWNLNQMGRTWDEHFFVDQGYRLIELIKKRDFNNVLWYQSPDPPPLAKYFYGIAEHLQPKDYDKKGNPIYQYDFTLSRFVSVILSSLTVVTVILIGWHYISPGVGVVSGVILAMLPFFLGLSQLATIESPLIFFFTASVYSFLRFLESFSYKKMILTGILVGLSLLTKYTNVLLIPLLLWIYILWLIHAKEDMIKNSYLIKITGMLAIAFFVAFILWPMPWFHIKYMYQYLYDLRVTTNKLPVPEVFFGQLVLVPKIYYVFHFIITTPLFLLFLFLIGLKNISDISKKVERKKKWVLLVFVAWFCLPFIQSLYNFRQHGIRYIIEIYAPFSLIAAVGFNNIASKFTKNTIIKILYFAPVFLYMMIVLIRITPYYLDYFNILVGGTRGVYEKRLFQLGWWGQGIKEAGMYIMKNAKKGSRIGIATSPTHVVPMMPALRVSKYKKDQEYDYVLVNYYNILREGFDDSDIKKKYNAVYNVSADGAILATVYQLKKK